MAAHRQENQYLLIRSAAVSFLHDMQRSTNARRQECCCTSRAFIYSFTAAHTHYRPIHHGGVQYVCVLQVIAKAADGFSAGDIVNKRVRQFQSWSLMPFAAVVGSVYPSAYMRGSRETFGLFPGEMNFPRCLPHSPSLCEWGAQQHLRYLSNLNKPKVPLPAIPITGNPSPTILSSSCGCVNVILDTDLA